jgi:threonine/homoserine/homoserine lactone efflux protein
LTEAIIKGVGLGLILALSVGPVIFTVLKQSINNGHRGGFSFVAGVWISDIVLVVISNFFTQLVKELLEFKSLIGYFGSSFLIGMGIFYIFFKKVNLKAAEAKIIQRFRKRDFTKIALSGFFINTLNPSVLLFWLVNATAFAATNTLGERFMIFSICLLVNIIADILKVLMAGKIRDSLTPKHILLINRISGSILVIFGMVLIYGTIYYKGGH